MGQNLEYQIVKLFDIGSHSGGLFEVEELSIEVILLITAAKSSA